MRKLTLVGLGVIVALALPTTALAQQNTYGVTASVNAANAVKFGYTVGEAGGLKPGAVKRYTIGFGGMRLDAKHFKTCKVSQMAGTDRDCNAKALAGSGTLDSFVYPDKDPSGRTAGFTCKKTLHVWNAGAGKAVLFLNGDPSQCGGVGALPPIPAKFVKFGANGTALQFDVPATVMHPIAGLTVAVTGVTSKLKAGYLDSIAKKHPVQVTFVTEAGQTAVAKTVA